MRKKRRQKKFALGKILRTVFEPVARAVRFSFPIVCLFLVFGLSFAGIRKYLFADDLFSLTVISTKTNGILTPADIAGIAGIRNGDNILTIDLQNICDRLKKDRRIKEAVITRSLPNQIAIDIKERREFIRLRVPGRADIAVMDEEGYLLGAPRPGSEVVLFEDFRPEAARQFSGERYHDLAMLRAILTIREVVGAEPLLRDKKLTGIKIENMDRIAILFEDGFMVRVGEDFRGDLNKFQMIRSALVKDIADLEYIDLRFENIVAKKRGSNKRQGSTS